MTIPAYPLHWPSMMPRSTRRESGAFKTSLAGALKNVEQSLQRFGKDSGKPLRDVVLSSNCALGQSRPTDPGVAAWFIWDNEQFCIPVDRYTTPEANLQAIHHVLEARRVELRHGTLALVKATFRGFKALASPNTGRAWREVLGVSLNERVTAADLKTRYRTLAARLHPDKGGTHAAMSELNAALASAELEITR